MNMLTTLKAVVHGDRIEWLEASEDAFPPAQSVTALITPLQPRVDKAASSGQRVERRLAALKSLASINAFSGVSAPDRWQREIREDRDLPGRV